MSRRVFFSFHYERDVRRIMTVRNSWVIRAAGEAQPFYDAAEFEAVKRRAGGIQKWIDEQLKGTSVTVVLFGAETYKRPWVLYEIERSHALGKGLLAVGINKIKDPLKGVDVAGKNPLGELTTVRDGCTVLLSSLYRTYDWVDNDGYNNISTWIEQAARSAGR